MYFQVGLNVLIQKANKLSPATRMIIQRLVPFPAVGMYCIQEPVARYCMSCYVLHRRVLSLVFPLSSASANICNVGLMRHNELSEGIDVLDCNGNVVGSSKIAAKHVSDKL